MATAANKNEAEKTSQVSRYYIYSTLSADQLYTVYRSAQVKTKGTPNLPVTRVLIKGKANVANPADNFRTVRGVLTVVSAEQYAALKTVKLFNQHVEKGYVVADERKEDIDVITSCMTPRDKSAPLTPEDYPDKKAPVTNKVKSEPLAGGV